MNGSSIKRGLANTAISALAMTGLPWLPIVNNSREARDAHGHIEADTHVDTHRLGQRN